MANMHQFLKIMIEKGASDLHITTGSAPQLRIDGKLHPLRMPPLSPPETKQLCYSVLTDSQKHRFEEDNELDLERARASFAEDPESKADDAVDAVVRRLEAGGADPDRLDGLRRWLRHVGDHVVLRVGPDDIADRYLLRATMSHVDGAFYLIESITSCNFLWEPIPES